MNSEDFFYQYSQGRLSDDVVFIEWANDYRHYLALPDDVISRHLQKLENETALP